ncbi:MAG: hypothetical protein HOE90_15965 [Bacteriovoracaceae bacterium]|nr:hypothetical protein [Bacteriovoracaceae bacterium]
MFTKKILTSLLLSTLFTTGAVAATGVINLFKTNEPLQLTLVTDWDKVRAGKKIEDPFFRKYTMASLVHSYNGKVFNLIGQTRVRGWDRLETCKYSPLKIKRSKEHDATGTVFEGSKSLKLVVKCNDGEKRDWVKTELLIYKLYNALTDLSLETRPVNVEYVDRRELDFDKIDKAPFQKHFGFFIESPKNFAKRKGLTYVDEYEFSKKEVNLTTMNTMFLFNYMIGNQDVEISKDDLRNTKLFQTPSMSYIPVAYDFDWADMVRKEGVVEYDYDNAVGFCGLSSSSLKAMVSKFAGKRAQLASIIDKDLYVSSRIKTNIKKSIGDFFKSLSSSSQLSAMAKKFRKSCK